jgi:subtilisin family serine protease
MRAPAKFLVVLPLLIACLAAPAAADKIKIANLDELPRHTYPVAGSVSAMVQDDASFNAFADAVAADIETDLETYEIPDAATVQNMYKDLLTVALMRHEHEKAVWLIEQIRKLEDKEAQRLMSGQTAFALIAARDATGADGGDAFLKVFGETLDANLRALPWDVVQTDVIHAKGRMEIFSETLILGMIQGQLDPIVAQTGAVSSDLAGRIVNLGYAIRFALPLKDVLLAVYGGLVDANRVEKTSIWPAREVTLDAGAGLQPVVIGIWDSGVDVPIFGDRVFVNKAETLDGKDDDGNGFVDDVNGLAFNYDGVYEPHLLYPLGENAARIDVAMGYMKGFMDLQSSIDSPEASELKAHIAGLDPAAVNGFFEDLSLCGLYAHGTHVAGIASAGNPYALLLPARISFDYHSITVPLTGEMARRHAASYPTTIDYFKAHGVRVVNMSWGWGLKEIEAMLEANNIGADAEERGRMASERLGVLRESMYAAMQGAPGILFMVAAGNDDADVEFDATIPSGFDLPNLLVVGAVDQAGDPTGFTSSGRNVKVYANGFEVESYVPGGRRMKMSGTSMASPQVCNLAGKLFALDPSLTPAQVAELIRKGADQRGDFLLMNPKATVALLK